MLRLCKNMVTFSPDRNITLDVPELPTYLSKGILLLVLRREGHPFIR